MLRWVLLACLAALAGATSVPALSDVSINDIGKYAIFLADSKAHETTTFTLKQTVIKITKHSAAESQAQAVRRRIPRIIVKDAAAKGQVCVPVGQVQVTEGGQVVEGGAATSAAAAGGHAEEHHEGDKAEDLVVGQGQGVVASVSSAAAAGGGAASAAASGGGVAASSAAAGGGAASSAAGGGAASSAAGGGAASSAAAGEGSAASSAAGGEGSAASSAAGGEGSAASSAAGGEGGAASSAAGGEGSAASSAAGGEGSAASSAAGDGSAASSAAGDSSAASSAAGGSTSSSSVSAGGDIQVEVSGGGEAAAYSGGEGVHISGDGHATYVDERFCTCVPDYLCGDDGYINTSGENLIDIRSFTETKKTRTYASKCKLSETCCKHRDNEQIGWTPTSCGERSPIPLDRRIVGGEASGLGRYPWVVAIIRPVEYGQDQYVCGGSLIRHNIVMTGAHCVDKLRNERLIARVGEWDTCNDGELYPHSDIDVVQVQVHEGFNPDTLYNDVALLTLSTEVEPAPHINTICLPDAQHIADVNLYDCVATGWGKEAFDQTQYTNILKEVPLSVVDHDACQEALRTTRLGQWFQLHDTFLCAGGKPNVDTCRGDGGGSLVCRIPGEYPEDQKFVQVGIVAWGIGCGKGGIPGVYADVQKLLPWIESHLPQDGYP